MITRIEIDGFKSFEEFSLDLEPFTVLAGPNNSGKANLLEAILLLRDLEADYGDDGALVHRDRGTGVLLFRRSDDGTACDHFSLSANIQLPGVKDRGLDVVVRSDQDDRGLTVARGERSYLNAGPGTKQKLDWLRSWTMIDPIPGAMRGSSSFRNVGPLEGSGANLAAVIGRISEQSGFREFVRDAAYVIGDLVDIRPVRDARRSEWDFDLMLRGDRLLIPPLISDGTLRVIALLAAVHDPQYPGVIMIEELENGLHPAYVSRLIERLFARAANSAFGMQVIATTHSPIVVSEVLKLSPKSVVFFDQVAGAGEFPGGARRPAHTTRARRVAEDGERGTVVPPSELQRFLDPAGVG